MSAPENPAAFPKTLDADERAFESAQNGMTLRDWFAGQVAGEYAKYGPNGHAPATMVAAAAYELADAMLAARQIGGDA